MAYSFGVLDNMRMLRNQTAQEVLEESLQFAILAEKLGYQRYWLAEHHGFATASSAPEILTCAIAARTQHIRVGAGGILLPHYSSLKVAEVFATLTTLYPGRIDLGIGSAPGASEQTVQILQNGMMGAEVEYTEKLERLLELINASSIDVEVWLLGKGTRNAKLAARFGTSFAFGSTNADSTVLEQYRSEFKASTLQSQPRDLLAIMVVCAETEKKAEELAWSFYQELMNNNSSIDSSYLAPAIQAYSNLKGIWSIANLFPYMIVGDPIIVHKQLALLGNFFNVNEFIISTIPLDFKDRCLSYELIAEAFNLAN